MNVKKILLYGWVAVFLTACNPWEDHVALNHPNLGKNVMEVIKEQSQLSTTASLMERYGYDQSLSEMSSCTVFAPNNEAWTGIDVNDSTLVKGILGSMITSLKIRSLDSTYTGKILTINGKSMSYNASTQTFESAKILTPDIISANAYIHIVDKVIRRKDNIWEALEKRRSYKQVQYLTSMNTQIMDMDKSVQAGIDGDGKIIYDPVVMKDYNAFLEKYSLNNEETLFTYLLIEDAAFDRMCAKYAPYFKHSVAAQTDSLVCLNICGDYVVAGIVESDLSTPIYNTDSVLLAFDKAQIRDSIDCSNGKIYIMGDCSISMKNKIRPIRIEGENYNNCMDPSFLYKRYKNWASGSFDVMLNGKSKYENFVTAPTTGSGNLFNGTNYWIEYLADVYSVDYYIEYVAYDDIDAHDGLQLEQKMFISLPGALKLSKKSLADSVANNYLGNMCCFVGQSWAASPLPERSRLCKWTLLDAQTQFLSAKLTTPDAEILSVPTMGELTLWLCNTTRYSDENAGFMFLDYIELIPIITEE